jgi:hypothetical protein
MWPLGGHWPHIFTLEYESIVKLLDRLDGTFSRADI